ncbi:pseudaminic acid cytidylyltransferase [Empedobacter falsenii]
MNFTKNNLCIIPARGGSKRIPKKNIKFFLGKPIIAYSIEIARKSGLFEEIMVSTDDPEIAQIAEEYGAKVPFFRSKETSDDFAPLRDVVDEVLEHYSSNNKFFENVCCILPTAPLLQQIDIVKSLEILESNNFDSVRPIVKFSYPIQRAFKYNGGLVEMFNPEFLLTRSQDLEDAYHDAGMFYWLTFEKGFKGEKKGAYVIAEKYAQDIDTLEDWEIAEFKYNFLFSDESN